jgi:UDP-GlcNAc:undecaprenyl-phosphate GlcNAc-1-phosphate transferase
VFLLDRYPDLVFPIMIFLLAFFISLHLTGGLWRFAQVAGIVDRPGGRKTHAVPVPCLGGAAIYLAVLLSLGLAYGLSVEIRLNDVEDMTIILAVGTLVFLVGLLDDLRPVPAWLKLVVLAIGAVVLSVHGIGLNRTPFGALNALLTFLWIAGVASAFNAIDNKDGLAGGVALISATALFAMGWSSWQLPFSFLAMAIAGGTLGFLHHNMNPAKIYMGDSGSFTLGYFIAVLIVYGDWSDSPVQSFVCGCLIVVLPAFDLALTSCLRLRYGVVHSIGEVIAHCDTDHLAHRLLKLGLSHRRMLTVLLGVHALCCLAGAYLAHEPVIVAVPVLAGLVLVGVVLARYADRASASPDLWTEGRRMATTPPADRREKSQ